MTTEKHGKLVIARKPGEAVTVFGENGKIVGNVTVEEVRGEKVRISFSFPKNMRILRTELVNPTELEK